MCFSHPAHSIYELEYKYLPGCGHPWSPIKVTYFLHKCRDFGSPWSVFCVFMCSFFFYSQPILSPMTAGGKHKGEQLLHRLLGSAALRPVTKHIFMGSFFHLHSQRTPQSCLNLPYFSEFFCGPRREGDIGFGFSCAVI